MGMITVIQHGIGLWVQRKGDGQPYWDLLFPAAERRELVPGSDGENLPHHDPRLYLADANCLDKEPNVYDLRDCRIDLRGLAVDLATATFTQDWLPQINAEQGSAVQQDNIFAQTNSPVRSMITFPRGILTPATNLTGPVELGTNSNLFAPFKIAWTAPLKRGVKKELIISRRKGKEITVQLKGDDITLEIQNLAVVDRDVPKGRRPDRQKDDDFGAHYLLTQERQQVGDVPKWPEEWKPTLRGMTDQQMDRMADPPEHLCLAASVQGETSGS